MVWTSTRQNTTQLLKLCEALVQQFPWRCYGNIWWNQRTPSPLRRWGRKTTTSHGRDAAVALPSTWSQPPVDLSSDSPPASSEMTRGLDSASPVVKALRLTVQETWWDTIFSVNGNQMVQDSCSADFFFMIHLQIFNVILHLCLHIILYNVVYETLLIKQFFQNGK